MRSLVPAGSAPRTGTEGRESDQPEIGRSYGEPSLPEAQEQTLRQLAEHLGEVFWLITPDHKRLFYASPAYEMVWGRSRDELYRDPLSFLESVVETDRRRVRESLISQAQGSATELEYRILRPDGELRWVLARGFPLADSAGQPRQLVGLACDITTRKRGEEQRLRQHDRLARVERLSTVGEMGATLAHELNQPLSAISNYAVGCLRRQRAGDLRPKELVEALQQILKQSERSGEILRRMRRFVRSGEVERSDVSVTELIHDVLLMTADQAQAAGVTVHGDLEADLPLIRADRIGLQQVFTNLVSNALEAVAVCEPEHRQVRVQAALRGQDSLLLSVIDQGPGLRSEQAEQFFAPFFSTKPKGLGLGLSISRSIAESHGGRLWANANPTRGAAFHVCLPLGGKA